MRFGLLAKFSIISAVVLLFTMTVFTFFNIMTLQKAFMDIYASDVDSLSETILRTTYNAMLSGRTHEAYEAMEQAGLQEGIVNIRLIDKGGIVRFSLIPGEIDTYIDKDSDSSCQVCHKDEALLTDASIMDRTRVFETADNTEVMGMTRAIFNQPDCYTGGCHYHPPDANLLGVLDLVTSLEGITGKVAEYRKNVLVELVFLVLALAVCLYYLITRLIISPVNTLLEQTRALSRGEWRLVENAPHDEIGELANAFNDMTLSLKKAREERERWAATLETKVEERTRQIREMQSVLVRSEKLASLGELSAGIAHELNNPLTGIILHASILDRSKGFPEDLRDDLETITGEAQRCARIVRNLLDFSRKTEPQKSMASINQVIERALDLVKDLSVFHNIKIIREYSIDLPDVLVDSGQLEQVFINMFVNASQAMEEGGILTVMTGLDPGGKWVLVQVRDTGKGIREEYLGKIFDPFFSTKGAKGTGLGLSVSYGIVEGHGGTIEVQSEMGKGTVFTIKLPV
ncbi:MAG: HAMP domain-containing protein [Proteobacteria bacterium]|nr:HAMP domain-containing protein [Pseudomonadota bacterium]